MRSTEEVELPKTQHHHHAAYNTVRRELQLFSNLCEREPPGVLTPTCSAERFHRSNYKTGNITTNPDTFTNPARVRHLDSLSLRIQTTAFFHLSSSKPPRMLADEWQSNPNRTGQGQGKAEADQRDHIHTANEIISITGGGREVGWRKKIARATVRTRRQRKQSHRPDQRKSWFLAQGWLLLLSHPPQP